MKRSSLYLLFLAFFVGFESNGRTAAFLFRWDCTSSLLIVVVVFFCAGCGTGGDGMGSSLEAG
jgi:Kef-type K+ transport system membrane component KefB